MKRIFYVLAFVFSTLSCWAVSSDSTIARKNIVENVLIKKQDLKSISFSGDSVIIVASKIDIVEQQMKEEEKENDYTIVFYELCILGGLFLVIIVLLVFHKRLG